MEKATPSGCNSPLGPQRRATQHTRSHPSSAPPALTVKDHYGPFKQGDTTQILPYFMTWRVTFIQIKVEMGLLDTVRCAIRRSTQSTNKRRYGQPTAAAGWHPGAPAAGRRWREASTEPRDGLGREKEKGQVQISPKAEREKQIEMLE